MAGEPIGEIDVLISGDYSGLQDAINQAVSLATSGASAIEEAFSSANVAQTANQAAGQIQVMGQAFADAATRVAGLAQQFDAFAYEGVGAISDIKDQLDALNQVDLAGIFNRAASAAQGLTSTLAEAAPNAQQLANAVGQTGDAAPGVQATTSSMDALTEAIIAGVEALGTYKIGEWILEQADEFQAATQSIVASTGAIGDELATLQGDFQNVFADVPQSAADVGTALGLISSKLGETGTDLDNFAKTLADISTITGESLDTLASKATSTFNQWQVATDDQIQQLTNLLNISEAAGVPLTQLLQQVNQFGPALREMGLGLDQAAELMGSLDQQGYNAQQVIMALRTEMTRLAKEGVPDVAASMDTWVESIKNAATDTDALSIAAQGGARNATSLVEAIRSGAIDLDNFSGKLQVSTNSINDQKQAAETYGQVWTTVLHQLDVNFAGAFGGIGNVLKNLRRRHPQLSEGPGGIRQGRSG